MKHVFDVVLAIINLFIFVVLAYLFVTWASDPLVQADVSGTTGLPRWYNYAVASVAICFMAYHQICNVISVLTCQSNDEQVGASGLL
jgi:TRAP-type C4-dicarboxylate transport system permease small subunit